MSLINPPTEDFFDLMSTISVSAYTSGSELGWYSYSHSRCLWVDWSSISSHDFFMGISFPRLISDFPNAVYPTSASIVPKGKCRHRRATTGLSAGIPKGEMV